MGVLSGTKKARDADIKMALALDMNNLIQQCKRYHWVGLAINTSLSICVGFALGIFVGHWLGAHDPDSAVPIGNITLQCPLGTHPENKPLGSGHTMVNCVPDKTDPPTSL